MGDAFSDYNDRNSIIILAGFMFPARTIRCIIFLNLYWLPRVHRPSKKAMFLPRLAFALEFGIFIILTIGLMSSTVVRAHNNDLPI